MVTSPFSGKEGTLYKSDYRLRAMGAGGEFPILFTSVIILSIGAAGLFAVIGFIKVLKYAFCAMVFFPLFTRIRREKVLGHFIRGQLFEHIRKNPGAHYNDIRKEMALNNGTLFYHLRTLELQGFIKSRSMPV